MYEIKQKPEDFVVTEIMDLKSGNGRYAYYLMKKKGINTVSALEVLSNRFGIPLKQFGFAGNKDKNAVTEQYISILRGGKSYENAEFDNISLKYLKNGNEPISLGDNKGNKFEIVIRNLDSNEINKIKKFGNTPVAVPNYFGQQRFGKNNHLIGKNIVKNDFKESVKLLIENEQDGNIKQHLQSNPNDFVGGIKKIPLKTRKIFVHAYQSLLFNKILYLFLKSVDNDYNHNEFKNIEIPLIGFGFDIKNVKDEKLKEIIEKIISDENINPRDFIIRQIPELSSEGISRKAYFEIKNFKTIYERNDELNPGMNMIKISFELEKGCFATTALDFIFNSCSDIVKNLI